MKNSSNHKSPFEHWELNQPLTDLQVQEIVNNALKSEIVGLKSNNQALKDEKKKAQESFEIDKSAHKTAQKKAKLRNLAKGNMNPNEKAAAEKKAGGPKLIGESYSDWKKKAADAIKKVAGKKEEKKAEKAQDAGARLRRKVERRVHAKYVSGSEDNVPDDIRDHYEVSEGKKKGLWDNIHAKRKRGEKPAKPGDKDYPKTLNVEGAAWTKKSGKSESGGLNEKGRKSYERENPGSDLKRPSKKVGNPRRKSFCARMKGMKKKLTSSKTANDPDSRINKSLRAWNC